MVRGIIPLGERASAGERRAGLGHAAGGALGAILTLSALWFLAIPLRTMLPAPLPRGLAIGLVLVAIARDLGLRVDTRQTQVPQRWSRELGRTRAYVVYGAVLGSAIFTHVPFGLAYSAIALSMLQNSLLVAAVAGALLGLGRTAPVPLGAAIPFVHRLFASAFALHRHRLKAVSALASVALGAFVLAS